MDHLGFLLSAVAQDAFGQVRGRGGFFTELGREALQVCTMHRGEAPAAPRGRPRCSVPEPSRLHRLGRCAVQQDRPGHEGQLGQPLSTLGRKDKLPCSAQHLLRSQGQPFDRPAIAIERVQLGPRQGQRRVQKEGLVKARIMDQHGAEGRCARSAVYLQRTENCRARKQVVSLPSRLRGRGR